MTQGNTPLRARANFVMETLSKATSASGHLKSFEVISCQTSFVSRHPLKLDMKIWQFEPTMKPNSVDTGKFCINSYVLQFLVCRISTGNFQETTSHELMVVVDGLAVESLDCVPKDPGF